MLYAYKGGMMKNSKVILFPCLLWILFISTNAIGSTRTEQEEALKKYLQG